MDKEKFKLPPIFSTKKKSLPSPHFASPEGMLLPKEKQPPPMFGPNGATIPAKYLEKYKPYLEKYQKKFEETNAASKKFSQETLWCENCDFLFKNKSQLDKHLLEYSNCTIGDCSFHGCSRSVAKHIQELHTTGLYDKIKNLNTPEEIEKWRDERKKRYPTLANVQLRQKVQEERKKRGERIENNRSRFGPKNDTRKSNDNVNCSQMLKRKGQTKFEQFKKKKIDERKSNADVMNNRSKHSNTERMRYTEENLSSNEGEEEYSYSNIPKFQGTSSISDYISSIPKEKKVVKNVLASLVGMYGDSSDSEEDVSNSENESNDELPTKINQIKENIENSCNSDKLMQNTKGELLDKNHINESSKNDLDLTLFQDETMVYDDKKINIFEKNEDTKAESDIKIDDTLHEGTILRKLADEHIHKPPQIGKNTGNNYLEKLVQSTEGKVLNNKNHINENTQNDLDVKLLQDETVVNDDKKINTFVKDEDAKAVSDIEIEDAPLEEPILRKLAVEHIHKHLQIGKNTGNNYLEKLVQSTEGKVLNNKKHINQSTQNDLDVKLLQNETVVNDDKKNNTFEKDEDTKSVSDIESKDLPNEEPILRKLADELIPKSSPFSKECKVVKTVDNDKIHRDERFNGGIRNGNRKSRINSKIRKTGFLLDYSKLRKTPQNTLLEKLLEPQIRHERNVLLQCVRYVVNKNFFGIEN